MEASIRKPSSAISKVAIFSLRRKSLGWLGRIAIELPQMLRLVTPPVINQVIVLIKESAALSIITVPELTKIGAQIANETFAVIEPYLAVALLYWLLIELIALAGHWLERKAKHG